MELEKIQQAAVLLLTIGEQEASKVLKHLDQRESERGIKKPKLKNHVIQYWMLF